tara:strand:+ start:405 stop:602 length:198 start_codon:yes stop_codon:yes gene_type:complete
MSWKDVVKIFTPVREDEKCGYCGEPIGDDIHNRHSTRFKDIENPICSKCNMEKEIPRRMKAMGLE